MLGCNATMTWFVPLDAVGISGTCVHSEEPMWEFCCKRKPVADAGHDRTKFPSATFIIKTGAVIPASPALWPELESETGVRVAAL